jgi:hypothetical protein
MQTGIEVLLQALELGWAKFRLEGKKLECVVIQVHAVQQSCSLQIVRGAEFRRVNPGVKEPPNEHVWQELRIVMSGDDHR